MEQVLDELMKPKCDVVTAYNNANGSVVILHGSFMFTLFPREECAIGPNTG